MHIIPSTRAAALVLAALAALACANAKADTTTGTTTRTTANADVSAKVNANTADGLVERGRRIYEDGLTGDGLPVRAVSAGNSPLSGARAACTACHRRSGMGSREGRVVTPPVAGLVLFAKPSPVWPRRPGREGPAIAPLRHDARDAYDGARLARAIRHGIDSSGAPLDPLMPRYELQDADLQALMAYLGQLSARPQPGLDGQQLRLATIITPDADPQRASGVTQALQAWSRSGALGGIPIDLQVWRLEGAPTTWQRQLQQFHAQRPVFAVLSGAGRARWEPVRDFCEQAAVPCLFPIVDLAPDNEQDFYGLYLSRGVPLEARILARQIKEMASPAARVVQFVDDEAGEHSARLLAEQIGATPQVVLDWRVESPASMMAGLQAADVLVGWLSPAHMNALAQRQPDGPGVRWVVFSAQLAPPAKTVLPRAWRQQVRWISLRSDPQRLRGQGVLGLTPWLARLQLPDGDQALLAEVYAATYFLADALARMHGPWSREYLLETLETAHYNRPAGSAYFALSLAPGQREAAKAGHLLGFAGTDLQELVPVGPRLAP